TQETNAGLRKWQALASSSDGNNFVAGVGHRSSAVTGYVYTHDSSISTPTLTTEPASGVNQTSATLNGAITSTGGVNANTRGFQYGLTTSYGTNTTENGSFGSGNYSTLSSLTCGTLYHYRSYATNSVGSGYGTDQTFTTSTCTTITTPTLTTQPATAIAQTTATFNGTITSTGGENVTRRGFQFGTTTSYGTTTIENGSFGTGAYIKNRAGLTCGTLYHYRSYATNSAGTSYGNDQTFTTSTCTTITVPTLTTEPATGVTSTDATLNGTIVSNGGSNTTVVRGFNYGLTTSYGSLVRDVTETNPFGIGSFSKNASSLICNTLYHYRSYATNNIGTGYGNDQTFTTGSCGDNGPMFIKENGTASAVVPATTTNEAGNIIRGINRGLNWLWSQISNLWNYIF
ncbi:MAG: hypothetical protein WCW29_03665, partial [Candidatus Paceibacterota bacterium]